MLTYIPKVDM